MSDKAKGMLDKLLCQFISRERMGEIDHWIAKYPRSSGAFLFQCNEPGTGLLSSRLPRLFPAVTTKPP